MRNLSNYVRVGARLVLPEASAPDVAAGGTAYLCTSQMQREVRLEFRVRLTEGAPQIPKTRRRAKPNQPETWGTVDEATEALLEKHGYDGIGFMLSREDPYTVIDLDKCRDPETGEVEAWALEIVREFDSLTFVSPSGTGLHIWIRGTLLDLLPDERGGFNNRSRSIEGYSAKHFMTWTGEVYSGETVEERQDELEALYRNLYPEPETVLSGSAPAGGELKDREVIEKCSRFYGVEFDAPYYRGDTSRWESPSEAVYWLLRKLAFVTRNDHRQMERLFDRSALGMQDKWRNRKDYRERSINAAIRDTPEPYDPENHKPRETRVRDKIQECTAYAAFAHPWKEKTGRADSAATDFFGHLAMLCIAHEANSLDIDMSVRKYAEESGISSNETAANSLNRLVDKHRLWERVDEGGPEKAARYRLREYPNSGTHKDNGSFTPLWLSEFVLLLGSRFIRNTSPAMPPYDKKGRRIPRRLAPPVESVGKVAAWILFLIHAGSRLLGKRVTVEDLEKWTGITRNHLRERPLKKLLGALLIEEVDGGYVTPVDVEARLDEELEISFSNLALCEQQKRHKRQRRIQRVHLLAFDGWAPDAVARETDYSVAEVITILTPPDHAPTVEEMRETRAQRNPDGEMRELERHSPDWGTFVSEDEPQRPIEAPALEQGKDDPSCIHSYGGHVYPGGKGCYFCDPDHPYRSKTIPKADELVMVGAA